METENYVHFLGDLWKQMTSYGKMPIFVYIYSNEQL